MIIFPTNKPLAWDSSDAKILQDFLQTPVGNKVLHFLYGRIPTLSDGADVNKTLVRSGEAKGALDIFEALISLTVDRPAELQSQQTISEAYPSLENDAAWEDSRT